MTAATETNVRVAEVFTSIQGEGVSLGLPSVFVRLQGCSVGCTWCDTKYSWDASHGRALSLDALLDEVRGAGPDNVVVTGGPKLTGKASAFIATVTSAGLKSPSGPINTRIRRGACAGNASHNERDGGAPPAFDCSLFSNIAVSMRIEFLCNNAQRDRPILKFLQSP